MLSSARGITSGMPRCGRGLPSRLHYGLTAWEALGCELCGPDGTTLLAFPRVF